MGLASTLLTQTPSLTRLIRTFSQVNIYKIDSYLFKF